MSDSPVAASHKRTRLFIPPDASSELSGAKPRVFTVPSCTSSKAKSTSGGLRQTWIAVVAPAAASNELLGAKTADRTHPSSCRVLSLLPSGSDHSVTFLSLPQLASSKPLGATNMPLTSPSTLSSFSRTLVPMLQVATRFPAPEKITSAVPLPNTNVFTRFSWTKQVGPATVSCCCSTSPRRASIKWSPAPAAIVLPQCNRRRLRRRGPARARRSAQRRPAAPNSRSPGSSTFRWAKPTKPTKRFCFAHVLVFAVVSTHASLRSGPHRHPNAL